METLKVWFITGLEHILDLNGYDHILYVVALTILYNYVEWKKLLWLITAFTVGHSFSLALSTFNIINIEKNIIEIFIVCSILITCVLNIICFEKKQIMNVLNYGIAVFFGLIHGLGFSYLLKEMLGGEENIMIALFYFNLGLEVGQIVIVLSLLLLTKIALNFFKIRQKHWVIGISTVIFMVAFFLLIERL